MSRADTPFTQFPFRFSCIAETARAARGLCAEIGGRTLDLLLPPRCLLCGGAIEDAAALCGECWRGLAFLGPPCCIQCGQPFPYEIGGDALCPACAVAPPEFDQARAVLVYDEASRRLVLALKHADQQHGVPAFGSWLARAGADLLEAADCVAPVPLHWRRLFARRYNQSALLARALVRAQRLASGKPYEFQPDLLIRRRATPPQGRLSRSGRLENVRGAFVVNPRRPVRDRHVVLIDDVFTTGATVTECAKVLKRAGARRVDVLTLARVVRAT